MGDQFGDLDRPVRGGADIVSHEPGFEYILKFCIDSGCETRASSSRLIDVYCRIDCLKIREKSFLQPRPNKSPKSLRQVSCAQNGRQK